MAVKHTNDGRLFKQGRDKPRIDEDHVHTIKSGTVDCSYETDNWKCPAAQTRQAEINAQKAK